MYEHIPNLEHTLVNKGSMKALQRFTQIEMKEHDHGEEYIFLILFFSEDASDMNVCKELDMLCI